jgi:flagellar biosynthesis chaperone FliJ
VSQERRRRAERIIDARQRGVDLAEAELASFARKTLEALSAAEKAREASKGRVGSHPLSECSSEDLSREHEYLVMLEKKAERLAQVAREAKREEEGARLKVCIAKTEHKKVETWRDRLVEASKLEELRLERVQSDELAARVSRKS